MNNTGEPAINTPLSSRLRWFITLTFLLLIYATLGIVRPIAEQLRTAGFLRISVAILFILFTLMALAWRQATAGRKQMLVRVVLITSLLLIGLFMPGLPEERLHFLTYGLLGWLICWSAEAMEEKSIWHAAGWLLPCLLVWLAGAIDELIQWWLPVRVFDVRDIVFNGAAGMMGIGLFGTGSRKSGPSTPSSPLV